MMPRKLAKTVRIIVEQTRGSHFGPKESDSYFPCYGAVMSLVTKSVKFHDCCIAWEIADFLRPKFNPPVYDMFYLHKYSHSFSQFPWLIRVNGATSFTKCWQLPGSHCV